MTRASRRGFRLAHRAEPELFQLIRFLGQDLGVASEILEAASVGCEPGAFVSLGQRETSVAPWIAYGDGGAWIALPTAGGTEGAVRLAENRVEVRRDTNGRGLALALRGLFSLAIERQGGILVHASSVSWDGHAALITGESGAGKSTLARWALKAGATLLSDEVVGLLPDGRVAGTPFRSDPDLNGTPTVAKLAVVATVKHGHGESFEDRSSHRLVEALCVQAFNRVGQLSARQVLGTVSRGLTGVRTGEFTCRNGPEAGEALRDLVMATQGPDGSGG